MTITDLRINHFRNIVQAQLTLSEGINAIVGKNGSGKTSLLEAMYYLGHAKSFRTLHTNLLINKHQNQFILYCQLHNNKTIGIQKSKKTEQLKISKQPIKAKAELVRVLPIQIINPDVHKILEDSPRYRRRFIDWGVFHVEHTYLDNWKKFQTVLRQRNAALKNRWEKRLIEQWDLELIKIVEIITNIKQRYVNELSIVLKSILIDFEDVSISYSRGWGDGLSYSEALEKTFKQDEKIGFTKYGPHRADLKIHVSNYAAKDIVSRGQQKYLACLLKIAQIILFHKKLGQYPIILLDDIFSELDSISAGKLVDIMSRLNCQQFITAIEKSSLEKLESGRYFKMFHVEHGRFQEVV